MSNWLHILHYGFMLLNNLFKQLCLELLSYSYKDVGKFCVAPDKDGTYCA